MISVTDVSTDGENQEDMQCIICRNEISEAGVRTISCKHAYHKERLEHWIHSAEMASHNCPYCCTELFPRPEYRPKDRERVRNYEEEPERLGDQMKAHSRIYKSAAWFKAELEMQRGYERFEAEKLSA